MVIQYVPKKADLVLVNFSPQAGHEQQGRRPALIISNTKFNHRLGLALACPITNTDRGMPFHIPVNSDKLTGFIMSEQVKSIDYKARKIQFVDKAKNSVINQVLGIIDSIIF